MNIDKRAQMQHSGTLSSTAQPQPVADGSGQSGCFHSLRLWARTPEQLQDCANLLVLCIEGKHARFHQVGREKQGPVQMATGSALARTHSGAQRNDGVVRCSQEWIFSQDAICINIENLGDDSAPLIAITPVREELGVCGVRTVSDRR